MKASAQLIPFLLAMVFLAPRCAVLRTGVPKNGTVVVTSPDGHVRLLVQSRNKELMYAVDFHKAPVIEPSRLGMVVNGKTLGTNAALTRVERYRLNETYAYRGVHSTAHNQCNGARISISSGTSAFTVEARVFNDGAAFRYVTGDTTAAVVEKDNTGFSLPAGSMVWLQSNVKYYEGRYGEKKVEDLKPGELAGPPVTVQLPGNAGFAAITEGGLTDFAGMSLMADSSRHYQANLSGTVNSKGNISSPWRIIETGSDLNALVNCDIIASVSPPFDPQLFPDGYHTAWVKPGRSVWSWLAAPRAVTLSNMKHFTDLAARLGFEYNLVDEGWSNWKDSALHRNQWDLMKELVDYSAGKGVKIWVWKAYPDRNGIAGIKDPEQRKAFFRRCRDLGIAGLKVDFFDSESQEIIGFYQAALKDAAEYQLMMDFHGANKPTGETRTWPNEMSREAIRGMENRPPWAQSNTVLPFTRYLAGPADFTPVHFGDRMGEVSWAHHVASMVVFTSPFLCLGADPQTVLDNPCLSMIQSIPTTWDETLVLPQSAIGELAVYARRKGNTWFLAAMNGVNAPKQINVRLDFLAEGTYLFSTVKDDGNKQAGAIIDSTTLHSGATVPIALNGAGGFVGRLDVR